MAQNHIEQNEAPMTRGGTIQGPSRRYRRLRHPTFPADEWTDKNPLLQRGELGIESDTHQIKAGDGYTLWNDLPYATGGGGGEYVLKTGDTMSGELKFVTESQTGAIGGATTGGIIFYKLNNDGTLDQIGNFTTNGFVPRGGINIGTNVFRWGTVYCKALNVPKINNGADIAVPETGGTMVVATPPSGAGTYVLKAVVDGDGNITTQWVAE